jgi:hypothetical protein
MDIRSIAALISAFGVGGIAGIWARAEYERAQQFRDRMIVRTEAFLDAVTDAREALTQVAVSAAERDEPEECHVQNAERAIATVRHQVPALTILFPGAGEIPTISNPAFNIAATLAKILRALRTDARSYENRKDLAHARVSLEYHVGYFAASAHVAIWRRLYLHRDPMLAIRRGLSRLKSRDDSSAQRRPSPVDLAPADLQEPI